MVNLVAEIIYANLFQYEKVAYYTVKVENRPTTEVEDFFMKMSTLKAKGLQLGVISRRLMQMGKTYGAEERFFEKEAFAPGQPLCSFHFLKSDDKTDLCMRLYCVRLNESNVVLLNGGRMTMQNIRDCENCRSHYELAEKVFNAIQLAKQQNKIGFDGMDLLIDEGFLLQI